MHLPIASGYTTHIFVSWRYSCRRRSGGGKKGEKAPSPTHLQLTLYELSCVLIAATRSRGVSFMSWISISSSQGRSVKRENSPPSSNGVIFNWTNHPVRTATTIIDMYLTRKNVWRWHEMDFAVPGCLLHKTYASLALSFSPKLLLLGHVCHFCFKSSARVAAPSYKCPQSPTRTTPAPKQPLRTSGQLVLGWMLYRHIHRTHPRRNRYR
ncbi:hypothetical protein B0H10DRAFT_982509 [Mycena sp. CBHHK59/15]|nr:hypothetical protein B0H10DRAFT_982509 [Mycena sp. CBHHK59/15]